MCPSSEIQCQSRASNDKPRTLLAVQPMTERLRKELNQQRASLPADWDLTPSQPPERALYADPADQAARELEQDLAIHEPPSLPTQGLGRMR